MVTRISTTALIGLQEARDTVGLGKSHDKDDVLTQFINGISIFIENFTGVEWTLTSKAFVWDGDGTNRHLIPDAIGLTAVTACNYDTDFSDDSTRDVPEGSIYFSADGEIYLRDGYAFAGGFQNCGATVSLPGTVPDDLKLAVKMILKKWWKSSERDEAAIQSITREGQTTLFRVEQFPKEARGILENCVRPRIG